MPEYTQESSKDVEIRIFPLSKDEFEERNLLYTIYWFRRLGNDPYHFRDLTPTDFPAGSIAVFDFETKIFGQAITREDIKKYPEKQGRFTAEVRFVQSSIDIFSKYPSIQQVREILGRDVSENFTKLEWDEYQEILKLAGRIPK